ncbi:hypothetical protein [Sulfurimonas sp.]|uniref:hypothetical protein n=1 Tax=Sulfurimonas sp. TaxID=2022749 RepID=UPI003563FF12
MILNILQYGYLGLLAIMIYLCYKIISNYQKHNTPFIQTIILVIIFLGISCVGGYMGYLWADKELKVALSKETSLTIMKEQIQAARKRLESNKKTLKKAQAKALNDANAGYMLDGARDIAFKRAKDIENFINKQEENYQKEIKEIGIAFNIKKQ